VHLNVKLFNSFLPRVPKWGQLLLARPPNGPVGLLFCSLASVVVCNAAGGWAGRPAAERVGGRPPGRARERLSGRQCTAGQYSSVPLGRHLVIMDSMPGWLTDHR